MQPKAEKAAEIKKQTQFISATELDRIKSNEEQINNDTVVLDTIAKRNEEQNNNVTTVLDTARNYVEQPNKVAT
jgi:mevalonate pyrophosphate decarboxylase